MNFKYLYKNLVFENPLMNASGPLCTSFEELSKIAKSNSGAIVLKSATIEPRPGNIGSRYYETNSFSINSMGLPNPGYKELAEFIPKLKQETSKPIIASIAGFSKEEYLRMIEEFDLLGADALEINLSCPNIIGKPQGGYNPEYTKEVLLAAREVTTKPIFVKLPPYLDLVFQKEIAEILIEAKVDFVVLVNSPGNCLVIDREHEETVIKPKKGLGGLGGEVIKPIALGNVWSFYQLLEGKVRIIGVGGISTGFDAFEFMLAGADLLQIGTAYAREGPIIFNKVSCELQEIMKKKGYNSFQEFRGKLKEKGDNNQDEYNFKIK